MFKMPLYRYLLITVIIGANIGLTLSFAFQLNTYKVAQHQFKVVSLDLRVDNLQLWWKDNKGQAFKNIPTLKNHLSDQNQEMVFATNSGIYNKEYAPLGLHIENQAIITPLNTAQPANAKGNFSLLPNGVFAVFDQQAHIVTTAEYPALVKTLGLPHFATQSGPMLLIRGELHPRFLPDSDSLKIRSGVCTNTSHKSQIWFVISESHINFYEFAQFFRQKLNCQQALYLDGTLSQFYADGHYYGAPFWQVRSYVGIWTVTRPTKTPLTQPEL